MSSRRGRPIITLAAATGVVVAALVFSRFGPRSVPPAQPAEGLSGPASSQELLTDSLLVRQARAVADRDRVGYLAGWAARPSSQRLALTTYRNLTSLGVARVEPRVDEGTVSAAAASWTAQVDVTWGLTGLDATTATSPLLYSFAERAGRAVVVDVTPVATGREPVWLLPGLQVTRGARTLVAATDGVEGARVEGLLQDAVVAVGRVLQGWRGDLVAYAPATERQFNALIAAKPGQYNGIAAVTTTVDGSHDVSAPAAIVLNPTVFETLGPVGAHVVVTHEATHAATHAAAVSMPLWVAEGFADYVAIGSVDVPTSVAARGALRLVRRDGPPSTLPGDAAFAIGGNRLEATYEQAWLATSLIAKTYGQSRLVAFYRTVEAHPGALATAFVSVLHTSEAAFTSAWRADLQELAGAG